MKNSKRLVEALETQSQNLKDKLNEVAYERASKAMKLLKKRADDESLNFVKILEEQRIRILKTQRKHNSEYDQLTLGFANQELIQLRLNRNHWDKRLEKIERDLKFEPQVIKKTFEVATAPRIEPVGVIILWPLEAGDFD